MKGSAISSAKSTRTETCIHSCGRQMLAAIFHPARPSSGTSLEWCQCDISAGSTVMWSWNPSKTCGRGNVKELKWCGWPVERARNNTGRDDGYIRVASLERVVVRLVHGTNIRAAAVLSTNCIPLNDRLPSCLSSSRIPDMQTTNFRRKRITLWIF